MRRLLGYITLPVSRPLRMRMLRDALSLVGLAAIAGTVLAYGAMGEEAAAPRTKAETSVCSGTGFVWWNELLAPEVEKLTDFYAKVLGWSTKVVDADDQLQAPKTPNDKYTIFVVGDQEVAGLMKADNPVAIDPNAGWFIYIQVADIQVTIEKVRANGGTILRQPVKTPEGNLIALVKDPAGNRFGLATPAKSDPC